MGTRRLILSVTYQTNAPATPPDLTRIKTTSTGNGEVQHVNIDSDNLDAFTRLRVSGTSNRSDFVFTYDKQPLAFDEIVAGTGTATHDGDLRAVYLSTGGTASGAAAKLTQRYYVPYTPGNSQQILITGTLNPDALSAAQFANVRAEIGYGDTLNGVGFSYDTDGAHVFIRTTISGSTVVTDYDQADWNVNALTDVDWTKSQIFIIDFQSLAVGRIRFFLDRDGEIVQVHEIYNDNVRVGPYWQIASLPPYWSVTNTGTATATARVLAICCSVKSEGALDLLDMPGYPFTAANGASTKTVSNSLIPVLSIQLKTTFASKPNRGLVVPLSVSFVNDNPIYYVLLLNPTLTNSNFVSVDNESLCNYDVTASAVSGGYTIGAGYIGSGGNRAAGSDRGIGGKVPLSVNSAGTTGNILTVAAIRVGNSNAATGAALEWKEIR